MQQFQSRRRRQGAHSGASLSSLKKICQESTTPELDEKYWSRLIKSDENPGWLWDPIENEWVADPELSKGGDE